mmetsp:Transcript_98840/g.235643  ORF Transcript_98840/g.235643 Transcript_98840/m.235643 type:complete len:231 (+) Transcript_98840:543-1235(+)
MASTPCSGGSLKALTSCPSSSLWARRVELLSLRQSSRTAASSSRLAWAPASGRWSRCHCLRAGSRRSPAPSLALSTTSMRAARRSSNVQAQGPPRTLWQSHWRWRRGEGSRRRRSRRKSCPREPCRRAKLGFGISSRSTGTSLANQRSLGGRRTLPGAKRRPKKLSRISSSSWRTWRTEVVRRRYKRSLRIMPVRKATTTSRPKLAATWGQSLRGGSCSAGMRYPRLPSN